jgi:hypothetical protein
VLGRRRDFLPWVRLVLSVAAFVGAGYLAIAKQLTPPPSIPTLIATTAVLVVIGSVLPTLGDFRFGRSLLAERNVTSTLRAAFSCLVLEHNFSAADLRLHFFHVGWTWQRRWPPLARALVRVAYFSIKDDAVLSSVRWTKGTGLVGQVWADPPDIKGRAENVHVDPGPNAEAWANTPAEVTRKMTWEQAVATKEIQVVFAVAVLAGFEQGKVVAVLSADTSSSEETKFNGRGVKAYLRQTARLAWNSRKARRSD